MEICINNAWGTVCDQNELFDSDDVSVFCGQLTGFSAQGIVNQTIQYFVIVNVILDPGAQAIPLDAEDVSENYPIFLSDLTCEGSELSILDCERRQHQPTGLYSCDHSHDVAVRCPGSYVRFKYDVIIIMLLLFFSDIDECLTVNGGCEQNCSNVIGSFYCSCVGGYELDSSKFSCNGEKTVIICEYRYY